MHNERSLSSPNEDSLDGVFVDGERENSPPRKEPRFSTMECILRSVARPQIRLRLAYRFWRWCGPVDPKAEELLKVEVEGFSFPPAFPWRKAPFLGGDGNRTTSPIVFSYCLAGVPLPLPQCLIMPGDESYVLEISRPSKTLLSLLILQDPKPPSIYKHSVNRFQVVQSNTYGTR